MGAREGCKHAAERPAAVLQATSHSHGESSSKESSKEAKAVPPWEATWPFLTALLMQEKHGGYKPSKAPTAPE